MAFGPTYYCGYIARHPQTGEWLHPYVIVLHGDETPGPLDIWVSTDRSSDDAWDEAEKAYLALVNEKRATSMQMYKIEDPNDPDIPWVIYPTLDEAISGLYDMIEPLGVDMPLNLVINVVEMTQEEFDALPKMDR